MKRVYDMSSSQLIQTTPASDPEPEKAQKRTPAAEPALQQVQHHQSKQRREMFAQFAWIDCEALIRRMEE